MLARRARPKVVPQTLRSKHVPAPIGGLNTIDVGSMMPETDAMALWNLVPAEYGLRVRPGFKEWCTGLTGAADNSVRSKLPFTGSTKNGSNDRLFATTDTGIWDVSSSSAAPPQVVAFPSSANEAGFGSSCVCTTVAGKFLLYCDEENGLYVYAETTGAWSKVDVGTNQAWAALTTYAVGNRVVNGGKLYQCDTVGVSGNAGGPTGTGADIVDGSTRWDYVGPFVGSTIGPSLADQNLGYSADPASFVFVAVWKSRVWLVERDTARAWYLDVGAIYGTATSFNFGVKMRTGGHLVGLYNWSYDGGGGLDTMLVGISGGGDVVIYKGTDPTSAATFGLNGCWSVGAVPYGRNIATTFGGELLVLSLIGVVPLSKLVTIGVDEQSVYSSRKVGPLFNQLAALYRQRRGWSVLIHPTDNTLLVTHPSDINGGNTDQLAMAFSTKGWGRYRGLPIFSACVWSGELYFGTADGRICRNVDYVDNSLLADATSFSDISWSVLSSFRNNGNARQKRIAMLKPTLLTGVALPVIESTAKYRYDLVEPDEPTGANLGGWDIDLWDDAVWAGDYNTSQQLVGASGAGVEYAIAVRGKSRTRTILVGVDVYLEEGGLL